MGVLNNSRWERFAQELAKGKSAVKAYVTAGYKPHLANPHRLSENEGIKARVAEILERAAIRTEITIEKLTEMYLEDRKSAQELGQLAVAKGATDSLAKLHGLWIEKSEHKYKFEDLTDAELETALAQRGLRGLGGRAAPGDLRSKSLN
jgi:hypothetical protein